MAALSQNKKNPGSAGTDAGADQKSSRASSYKNGDAGSRDAAAASPFRPVSLVEIQQRLANPAAYAVKGAVPGLIPPGLTFIYGPSGAGKTFVAIGLGLHVADGRRIAGLQCNRGLVVYIAAENRYGVEERAALAAQHLGISDAPPFVVIDGTPALTNAKFAQKVSQDIRLLEQAHGVLTKLVIVDTVAASTASDSLDDDGRVSALCGQLLDLSRALDNASVVAVHHTGKRDETSERGSKVFRDRADASFLLRKQGGRTLIDLQKMRNGRSEGRYEARLISAAHEFAPGHEIKSLVMVDLIIDGAPAKPAAAKLGSDPAPEKLQEPPEAPRAGSKAAYVFEALKSLGGEATKKAISVKARELYMASPERPDNLSQAVTDGLAALMKGGQIEERDGKFRFRSNSENIRFSEFSERASNSDSGSENTPFLEGVSEPSESRENSETDGHRIMMALRRRRGDALSVGDELTAASIQVELDRLTAADPRP